MTGIICMWHGLIVDIPDGWALCDGTNGTPDLRERFVRGAANGMDPGHEDGSDEHFHVVGGWTVRTSIPHVHTIQLDTQAVQSDNHDVTDIGGGVEEYSIHTHELYGDTQSGSNFHRHGINVPSTNVDGRPPFYDVLFIMKT